MTNAQIRPNDVVGELFEDEELIPEPTNSKPKSVARSTPIGILAVLAGVVFLVAANVLGTKFGRSGLWITMWRSYIAAAILFDYVKFRGQHLNMYALKHCFVPAIAFTIHIICFYQAIQDTTLTNVVIIRSLQAPLMLFFVGAHFSEKVKFSNVAAAVTAVIGVALTVWGTALTGTNSFRGDVLSVLALCAWIALYITTKKARAHVGTATFMFITTSLSGLVATVILPFTAQAMIPDSQESVKLFAMAICASLGHGFISWAHKHTKLTTASLLTLLTPVGSTICAAIFFGQSITVLIGIGITIVMVSVATVVRVDRQENKDQDATRLDTAKAA